MSGFSGQGPFWNTDGFLGSGTPPFNPTQLTGLAWWLRADLGTTIATGVSQWNDQSGVGDSNRNVVQATGSQQPTLNTSDATFNNQATLSFSHAAESSLQSGTWSPSISDPYTIFVVGSDTNDGNEEFFITVSGTFRPLMIFNNYIIEGNADLISTTSQNTSKHIFVLEVNNTASYIRINQATPQITGSIAGHFPLTIATVGSYISAGFALNGKIAEIALVDHILSTSDMTKMLTYLGTRYNIAIGP